jgi:hypothetical protein
VIKIERNAKWLIPFINEVKDLVDFTKIKKIRGYWIPLDKMAQADAWCTRDEDGKYIVSVQIYEKIMKRTGKKTFKFVGYQYQCLAETLNSLAHELAHVRYWEHSINHNMLRLKIEWRFNEVLRQRRVKDVWQREILK